MNPQQIFGLQFVLSLFVGALLARWYVWPALATLPRRRALMPLLLVHATRYIGLVFLVPTVVPPSVPAAFAKPAAYGDLFTALLAIVALLALRGDWPGALPLAWLVNVVGVIDLINALFQGVRSGVSLGAAYYIPIAAVPVLLITHSMMFVLLGRRRLEEAL
jgi:hypothetical protein